MMQNNINRLFRRTWLVGVLLLCLLPWMGQFTANATEAKACPQCGKVMAIMNQFDAKCTTDGGIHYKCEDCSINEYIVIPKLGHWMKKREEIPATCLESAKELYRCSRCHEEEIREVEDSAPLGHEYAETVVPPTCSEDGYTLHTCIRCEDSYQTDVMAKVDHTYYLEIHEAPTCEQIGFGRNICTVCGYHEKVELPLADHSEIAQTVEPTHTEPGYTSYTCQHCGAGRRDDYTEPKPYDMVWTIQEPTCTEGGFRQGACADGCGHTETVVLPPKGHEFEKWQVLRAPDPENAGMDSRACKHCDYVETRSVPYVPEQVQAEEPKQITPALVLVAIFLFVFLLALLVIVMLLLLENSGGRYKRKRRRPSSLK